MLRRRREGIPSTVHKQPWQNKNTFRPFEDKMLHVKILCSFMCNANNTYDIEGGSQENYYFFKGMFHSV